MFINLIILTDRLLIYLIYVIYCVLIDSMHLHVIQFFLCIVLFCISTMHIFYFRGVCHPDLFPRKIRGGNWK